MWNRDFWLALLERCIKTFAQAAGALLIANGTGLIDTDWLAVASISGMAAVISVLTSIGSNAVTQTGPSITDNEVLPEVVVAKRAVVEDQP